ncbi:Gluconate transport-inducing protein [Elasticomyces elasticus]|nr:Gluconate transport-inducing protein [Elasticomyces elasticus]KAK4979055.1 Gluconate transport-inducing protein [Elasticomyces elasticus]
MRSKKGSTSHTSEGTDAVRSNGMETYNGLVRTPADAIILFEACRIGLLPRVQRRLSEKERQSIKSGSVFVWDEREAGMRRWTDGKSWSASRVSGSFLTYREMEGKRGGSNFEKNANRDGIQGNDGDSDGGPDGYRYKPDGLMKQSFSITTNNNQHLHLISYFSRASAATQNLMQPSNDPQLRHIRPEKGMYPESTVHEQSTIPAVTRGPMNSPGGYTHSPHQPSPYARPAPYGYAPQPWPQSPMHTPPQHPGYGPGPYYQQPYPGQSQLHQMQYPPQQQGAYGPTAYDRPPPPLQGSALPPPPQGHYPQGPPPGQYPPPYPYPQNGYQGYQPPPIQQQSAYPPPQAQQPQPYYPRQPEAAPQEASARREERPESQQPAQPQPQPQANGEQQQAQPGAQAPVSSTSGGQTIPSISSMLNGDGQAPQRPAQPRQVHAQVLRRGAASQAAPVTRDEMHKSFRRSMHELRAIYYSGLPANCKGTFKEYSKNLYRACEKDASCVAYINPVGLRRMEAAAYKAMAPIFQQHIGLFPRAQPGGPSIAEPVDSTKENATPETPTMPQHTDIPRFQEFQRYQYERSGHTGTFDMHVAEVVMDEKGCWKYEPRVFMEGEERRVRENPANVAFHFFHDNK